MQFALFNIMLKFAMSCYY